MNSSNPTLRKDTFTRFSGMGYANPAQRMTVNGTLNKSLLLFFITLVTASYNWMVLGTSPQLATGVTMLAALVGFGVAIATVFKKEWSPVTAPVYAAVEGLVLGGISAIFNAAYPGIVAQAVPLTFGVMFLMLTLYRTGILKATPMFTRVVVIATGAIALVYMLNIVLHIFGGALPILHTPTPLGILISLVIVGVAAMNFILDFDMIDKGAAYGAPKYMEWYGAFSICVTLFWLYVEILRLLSILNGNRR